MLNWAKLPNSTVIFILFKQWVNTEKKDRNELANNEKCLEERKPEKVFIKEVKIFLKIVNFYKNVWCFDKLEIYFN